MPRYCVSFMRWEVFNEYVEARTEDDAEAIAREQLQTREPSPPTAKGVDLIGAQVDQVGDDAS